MKKNFIISVIIPSFYPATVYGGPIFTSLHTCEELAKIGLEVRVSTTNTNLTSKLDVETNKWLSFSKNFFIKYYNETIIGKFSLQLYLNIHNDIKQADIIHIQGIFNTPIPISLLYAKLYKKPVLLSPHGSFCDWGLKQGNVLKSFWIKTLINPFSNFIYWHATCDQERNDILKQFPNAKVIIIPNGTDIDSFSKMNIFEPNDYINKFIGKIFSPTKIIVSMGRLHKKKGFDILIKSFLNVLNTYNDAILLIAGKDDGEQKGLDEFIKKHDLINKVFFVGEILGQDKIDFLANADLFALPSHDENFGVVYIESLAAGTPIVASLNTPWQEVEAAECGKWVANTVEETSQAMLEILKKDRKQMRINSQALAEKYDWKNIAIQFKQLFEEIPL